MRAFEDGRTVEQLRNAVRFGEIMASRQPIVLYDDGGRMFRLANWLTGAVLCAALSGLWLAFTRERRRALLAFLSSSVLVMRLHRHYLFLKKNVSKVVYQPEGELLLLTQHRLASPRVSQLSRYRLLYTENPHLRLQAINYINMDSLQGYSIPLAQGWKDQALFSHLISQRVSTLD
jgi:hypothetical protein